MTHTLKPPPAIAERQPDPRNDNAQEASFRLGELEMAVAQLVGVPAAIRYSDHLRAGNEEELADTSVVSTAEAAQALLAEIWPSGSLRSPLALQSAVLEGGGVQRTLNPEDALDHPALRALIRPHLVAFTEAMFAPDFPAIEPFPVETISLFEADEHQGAVVRLVLSDVPEFRATLTFGAFSDGGVVHVARSSVVHGHLPFLVGYFARQLRNPNPANEEIVRTQLAMATARAADAVIH